MGVSCLLPFLARKTIYPGVLGEGKRATGWVAFEEGEAFAGYQMKMTNWVFLVSLGVFSKAESQVCLVFLVSLGVL